MNDPHTMLAEPGDIEADEEERRINGCYEYVDDEDDDEECYEIDENYVEDAGEDYVEDADEDMKEDNPENLEEEDNYIDFSKKYDDYADEYKLDKSDFQYLG